VDKAVETERDGLWGRAYVDAHGLKEGYMKVADDIMVGAAKAYEQALKLQPSPQHKVGLFLALANVQVASGLDRSAVRTLEQS
jgi:hypothetical protein